MELLGLYWEMTTHAARETLRFFSGPITLFACVSLLLFLAQVVWDQLSWLWPFGKK